MTPPLAKHPRSRDVAPAGHRPSRAPWRWLPFLFLIIVIAAAYAAGIQNYLSLAAIAEHRDILKHLVARNLLLAITAYMLVYIAAVALSLPGVAILTVLGGFLFGWLVGAPVTVIAATLGSVIVFEVVRTSFGAAIAGRAHPFVERVQSGFGQDAFNYLLFLRLAPVFPFFAINAVAGLLRIRLSTFALATLIGITPAAFIFSYLGSGLDRVIEGEMRAWRDCVARSGTQSCSFDPNPSSLLTPDIIVALMLLAMLALIPVAVRIFKQRRGGEAP